MQIQDGWTRDDEVSGLKLSVRQIGALGVLHIEHIGKPIVNNRDFFFRPSGEFDGTGSALNSPFETIEPTK